MSTTTILFLLLWRLTFVLARFDRRWIPTSLVLWPRASTNNIPPNGFYDPRNSSGSMLTQVAETFPPGQGEPLNAILSAHSDADVLVDTQTNGGLRNYFLSIGYSGECLGQHGGSDQLANLGDGHGYLNETAVIRWDYGDPQLGTCQETIQGGDHFRYWVQNGNSADSGAVFMAASAELPIARGHDIIPNGYNLGRDWLIGNMTNQTIPSASLTNGSTYMGSTSSGGYTYKTTVIYVSDLLSNSSIGINHNGSVSLNGSPAIDGLVGILTVKITTRPKKSAALESLPISLWSLSSLLLSGVLCLLATYMQFSFLLG